MNIDLSSSKNKITSYSDGAIKISGKLYKNSVVLTSENISNWEVSKAADISYKDLQLIVNLAPEVVLIGSGTKFEFIDPKHFKLLYENNIGVEVMSTYSACRTYSALEADGRKVVACLIL